jgi:hypothetical protein
VETVVAGLLGFFITWALLYEAVKYGVLHAMRQFEEERGRGGRAR